MTTRRQFLGRTAAIASAGLVASRSGSLSVRGATTDWPTVQRNSGHTGYLPDVDGPVTGVEIDWQLDLDYPVYAQPVVAEDTIVVSATGPDADSGQLLAVGVDGDERWAKSVPVSVLSSPTIQDGSIYQTGPRTVTARSLSDGSKEWEINLPTSVFSSPVVAEDTVLIGTRTGSLTGRSVADGSEQWSVSLDDIVTGTPAVRNNLVVTGTDTGTVAGVNLTTGIEMWQQDLGSAINCPPTIVGSSVFVPTESGRLHALDLRDGTERWSTEFTLSTVSSPVVTDDTCYWNGENQIVALDNEDGTEIWQTETDGYTGLGHVSPLPVATQETLYASTGGETVYALDRSDGSERWTFSSTSGADVLSLLVREGRLFIGTAAGELISLSGRTNYRPTASFTYAPRNPEPGEEITFDATGSSDRDGSIEAYRWDFDGDGEIDATGPTVTQSLDEGQQTVRLEVEDNEGAIATTGSEQLISVGIDRETTSEEQNSSGPASILDRVPGEETGVAGGAIGLLSVLGLYRVISNGKSEPAETTDDPEPDRSPQQAETDESRVHPLKGTDASFGGFELSDSLGSGELTEVTEGTLAESETTVAMETLGGSAQTIHEDLFAEFADGIDVWSRIDDHPNVVSVLANGTEPFPWAALELCASPLDPNAVAGLSFEERRDLIVDVLEGVHQGHRYGLHHGALAPNNVMLVSPERTAGESPSAVISDWEVSAVQLDSGLNTADVYPHFASPEQIDSAQFGAPDPLTDIFQVGVLAYAVFTGSYPFADDRDLERVRGWTDVTPPSERLKDIPSSVDGVLSTSLAVEPEDRYQTALHFRDALKQV